jgi:hypothetical protein
MKSYAISFSYSRTGTSWTHTSRTIRAESETGAIMQLESMYPYVKNIRIMSVR